MPSSLDLTGQVFGRLTVLSASPSVGGKTAWQCACSCGRSGVFKTMNLRAGDTNSCGCMPSKRTTHGHNRKGARTKTYRIWAGMLSRCNSETCKDFKFYGAKGITVCASWHTFANFLADMGEAQGDMTLDRIDEAKGYEPSNCQWLCHSENSRKAQTTRWAKRHQPVSVPA